MKEALKLALEALEVAEHFVEEYAASKYYFAHVAAIAAIKEALAQPDQYKQGYADAMNWKTANHLEHLPASQQQHNLKLMPREATREMLEAMDECSTEGYDERLYAGHAASVYMAAWDVAPTLPKRKQEFIKHEVKNADDWSEWVCPDPKGYLMKCCDCGLVHEAEFGVVRYKSETEREECEMLDEPNLQAVFRMRRSEPWSSEDTAHRAGGLPMEQPKKEPVAWRAPNWGHGDDEWVYRDFDDPVLIADGKPSPNNEPLYTTPPQRTWVGLTDDELELLNDCGDTDSYKFARAIEAKLKEKNTQQDIDCKYCTNGCAACDARKVTNVLP